MTREKAIKNLKSLVEIRRKYCYMQTMRDEIDALDMAINTLEREPFMKKPCVAHQVCHEDKVKVLDKIRAKIKALTDGAEPEQIWNVDVLAIIDKYKPESEE